MRDHIYNKWIFLGVLSLAVLSGLLTFLALQLNWVYKKADFTYIQVVHSEHKQGVRNFQSGDRVQVSYLHHEGTRSYTGKVDWFIMIDGQPTRIAADLHGNTLEYVFPDDLVSENVQFMVATKNGTTQSLISDNLKVAPSLSIVGGAGFIPRAVIYTNRPVVTEFKVSDMTLVPQLNDKDVWQIKLGKSLDDLARAVNATVISVAWPYVTWQAEQIHSAVYVQFLSHVKTRGQDFTLTSLSESHLQVFYFTPKSSVTFSIQHLEITEEASGVSVNHVVPGVDYQITFLYLGQLIGDVNFTSNVNALNQDLRSVTPLQTPEGTASYQVRMTSNSYQQSWNLVATAEGQTFSLTNLKYAPKLTWDVPLPRTVISVFPRGAPNPHVMTSQVHVYGHSETDIHLWTWEVGHGSQAIIPTTWYPATVVSFTANTVTLEWYLHHVAPADNAWYIRATGSSTHTFFQSEQVSYVNVAWHVPFAPIVGIQEGEKVADNYYLYLGDFQGGQSLWSRLELTPQSFFRVPNSHHVAWWNHETLPDSEGNYTAIAWHPGKSEQNRTFMVKTVIDLKHPPEEFMKIVQTEDVFSFESLAKQRRLGFSILPGTKLSPVYFQPTFNMLPGTITCLRFRWL